MAKKGEMPDLIFVSPIGHGREKQRHVRVLFTVEEWDEDGIPRKLTLRNDEEVFDVQQVADTGTEFMTAYVPAIMTVPHPDKAGKKVDEPL